MREFSREPSRAQRVVAVVLTGASASLLGTLTFFLAYRSAWIAVSIFGALFSVTIVLLYRAAFTAPRALRQKEAYRLALCLLAVGIGTVVISLLVKGSIVHRSMVLSSALMFIAAGIAGIKGRGRDA
jgi:uncharacterized membrane protein HdeD (DUF308 family)